MNWVLELRVSAANNAYSGTWAGGSPTQADKKADRDIMQVSRGCGLETKESGLADTKRRKDKREESRQKEASLMGAKTQHVHKSATTCSVHYSTHPVGPRQVRCF